MTQDQHTYKRAATAAVVGLIAQVLLVITLAVLGVYGESSALHAVTWHFLGGLPIWLILWVVYNQHRLERAEALEAEQLARADARTAALFEEAGQQLQIARQRLENFYKFALPGVSLVVAGYLLGVGGWLAWANWTAYEAGVTADAALGEQASAAAVLLVALAAGFAAFLVARYVAGMTQVREWQLLRGGAAYLMGNATVAILAAAAALLAMFDNPVGFVWLSLLVPAVLLVLGAEMLIGFTFSLYRPRKAGEVPRPAFDSRVLGWLTRPESLGKIVGETLNYQFGFEISKSWFYRLLARAMTPLVVVAVLVLFVLSSLVVVSPQEQVLITTFGGKSRIADAGLHLKWPWPIGQAERFDALRVRQLVVGSKEELTPEDMAILWTNEHGETEQFMLTAPTLVEEAEQLIADSPLGELVGAEVVVNYRIGDLEQYATSVVDPERMIAFIAEREATRYFATHTIHQLLQQSRRDAGDDLRERIQAEADRRGLGLKVLFVGVLGVHPPQQDDVAAAFHEQINVLQENQTMMEEAERESLVMLTEVAGSGDRALRIAEAIEELERLQQEVEAVRGAAEADAEADAEALAELEQRITEGELRIEQEMDAAGGLAAQAIHEARAFRWQHALEAMARAESFASQLAAYDSAPRYTMMRLYLEALAEGLEERRKVIFATEQAAPSTIRLELEERGVDFEGIFDN